jgi:protein-disulfide isomerase
MEQEKNTSHHEPEKGKHDEHEGHDHGDHHDTHHAEEHAPAVSTAAETQPKFTLSAPVAILIGAVLISGAILAKSGMGSAPAKVAGSPASMLKKDTIAEEVGLKKKAFAECLASGRHKDTVEAQYQSGVKAGVQGTPFSVIVTKSGEMFPINGAQTFETVKQTIETALKGEKGASKIDLDPVTEKDHIAGNPSADLILVEYSDPECPFCKKFHTTMLQVMDTYGKDGKVAWVYRHFPLDAIHSKARKEAEAIECAGELGGNDKLWAYLNKLEEITPANNQLDPSLL